MAGDGPSHYGAELRGSILDPETSPPSPEIPSDAVQVPCRFVVQLAAEQIDVEVPSDIP